MNPIIKIECDCETTFEVKLSDACYQNGKHLNEFTLNCPYCLDPVGYKFHIEKLSREIVLRPEVSG